MESIANTFKQVTFVVLLASVAVVMESKTTEGAAKVVTVDCNGKDSINEALAKNSKEAELVIEIDGICEENVEIRRDKVTLRGTDPTIDGIEAVDLTNALGAAVLVRNALFVTLENLSLKGTIWGAISLYADDLTLDNCYLEGSQRGGLFSEGGGVALLGAEVFAGDFDRPGIVVTRAGLLTCRNCSIDVGVGGIGVFGTEAADILLTDNMVSAGDGGVAVWARQSSRVRVRESVLSVSPNPDPRFDFSSSALFADTQGELNLADSMFDGSFFVTDGGVLTMTGSTQAENENPEGNQIQFGAFLRAFGFSGPVTLTGSTQISGFSNAIFQGADESNPVTTGALICDDGTAGLLCGFVAVESSSCGACPPTMQ